MFCDIIMKYCDCLNTCNIITISTLARRAAPHPPFDVATPLYQGNELKLQMVFLLVLIF